MINDVEKKIVIKHMVLDVTIRIFNEKLTHPKETMWHFKRVGRI